MSDLSREAELSTVMKKGTIDSRSIRNRSVGHLAHVECSHCGRSQGELLALRWRYHSGCTLGSSYIPQRIQNKPRQESKPAHSMYLKYVMTRSRHARLGLEANARFQGFLILAEPFAPVAGQSTIAISWKVGLRFRRAKSHSLFRDSLDALLADCSAGAIR